MWAYPAMAMEKKDNVRISILHTNDMHSRIDAFPGDDPKYPGLGGMTHLAGEVKRIRSEEKNVLLLDAGDIFQGTPYFNLFGGEVEFKLMSEMGYAASTLGNHDFDNGVEGLIEMLPYANFPFVNVNYDLSKSPLKEHVQDYIIKEIDGMRVGIFGVGIELAGLVDKKNYGDIIYKDPIEESKKVAKHLKETERCDLIICLSHLGYSYREKKVSDQDLALENQYVDLIIGGHTHTMLKKPQKIRSKYQKNCLVNQVGWAAIRLGKIDFSLHKWTNESQIEARNLIVKKLV